MFEVGKLSDETLDSFLAELEKVRPAVETGNGDATTSEDNNVENLLEPTRV